MDYAVNLKVFIQDQRIDVINPTFRFKKELGEHVYAELDGIRNPLADSSSFTIAPEMDIRIYRADREGVLFQGIITKIDLVLETAGSDPLEKIMLRAASYSSLLDRHKHSRAFQHKHASYEAAAAKVLASVPESGVIMAEQAAGKQLEGLVVQYQETDWVFLARLASYLNLPLAASHRTRGPKLFFGPLWSSNTHLLTVDEEEQVGEISSVDGGQQGAHGFFWVTEKTDMEVMDIGDRIVFKGRDYYINGVEIQIQNHEISHHYQFGHKGLFFTARRPHNPIGGISLPGTVQQVRGNQLQVSLDLDVWEENDCWYSYGTFYSMFYCMPERGDRVFLYFPEAREASAFVLSSVQTSGQAQGKAADRQAGPGEADSARQAKAQQAATMSNVPDKEVPATKDISAQVDTLAEPEAVQMADLGVQFDDDSAYSLQEMGSKPGGGSGGAGRHTGIGESVLPPAADQSYDFENLLQNDSIKVLASNGGKMVILDDSDGSVSVVLNDGTYLVLNDHYVGICSAAGITLKTDGEISLKAGQNINLNGETGINLTCASEQIVIAEDGISLNGSEIKINE